MLFRIDETIDFCMERAVPASTLHQPFCPDVKIKSDQAVCETLTSLNTIGLIASNAFSVFSMC